MKLRRDFGDELEPEKHRQNENEQQQLHDELRSFPGFLNLVVKYFAFVCQQAARNDFVFAVEFERGGFLVPEVRDEVTYIV